MSGSVNKVTLVGNLGADPEIRAMQDGREVANLSIATTDSWKDKNTGEKRQKTEWHRVAIFSPGLVEVAKNYLKKGNQVYLEGALQTRKWSDQSGIERYTTEVVLQGYNATLVMLGGRAGGGAMMDSSRDAAASGHQSASNSNPSFGQVPTPAGDIDDEIPF